jgi:hypothetical protein
MRYKAVFIAGAAVGFVCGARAGRDTYDKMMAYGQQIAGHPKVQQAATTAQTKANELAKTAAAKTAQAQVSQVPKYVSSAKQAATSKLPARFGGSDSAATDLQDHVDSDGNLVYPAEGSPSQANGVRRHYTPDTP